MCAKKVVPSLCSVVLYQWRSDEVMIVMFEAPALPRGSQDWHSAVFIWFAETPIG